MKPEPPWADCRAIDPECVRKRRHVGLAAQVVTPRQRNAAFWNDTDIDHESRPTSPIRSLSMYPDLRIVVSEVVVDYRESVRPSSLRYSAAISSIRASRPTGTYTLKKSPNACPKLGAGVMFAAAVIAARYPSTQNPIAPTANTTITANREPRDNSLKFLAQTTNDTGTPR